MQKRVEGILRAINSNGRYNILTFPTHERFQSNWAGMPHTFYLYQGNGIKPWVNKYAQLPENHILLDGTEFQVKNDMKFDIVLSQNKFGQFQVAQEAARMLNVPLISLEHTLPTWPYEKQTEAMSTLRGDVNVFISDISVNRWKFSKSDPSVVVVEHGVDTNVFKPAMMPVRYERSINVCNDFINRDRICGYQEWNEITKDTPRHILGDTPGLSKAAASVSDLVAEYNRSSCLVSTTLISPIPTVVLEAMSCGLPVICLNNCLLPDVVKDGYNGFISNDLGYLKDKLKLLLNDNELRKEMGKNARNTILERFSLDKHVSKWMQLFDSVVGKGNHV